MKFLLVTSIRKDLVKVWVCQETSPTGSLLPPVDLASIAAVIKNCGHEVTLLDIRLDDDPMGAFLKEVESCKPDAILLNLSTTGADYDYELFSASPKETLKICFGTHAQSLMDECFDMGADFILIGDPEAAIKNLIENGFSGSIVKGVVTPDHKSEEPCYWEDLDSMPFPALDLLEMRRYHASYIKRGNMFTVLLGSRGCNFKCTYCLYPVLFGSSIRMRGVGSIADEMEFDLREFGISEFLFLDATFNPSEERVTQFCDELLKRRLKVKWLCNMRVSPVSAPMLALMKRAGCEWIFYGVEDQDFIKETKKGISKSATVDAFRMTHEAGILTCAFTMLFPERDLEEAKYANDILKVLRELKADAFQLNVAIPYPGTPMFKSSPELNGGSNWSLYDPHGDKLPGSLDNRALNVRRKVYRGFILEHPIKTLKIAGRMNGAALLTTVKSFIKSNILPQRYE